MTDDYLADTQTAGRIPVGGSVTGEIETAGDRDWFAVTLVAGKTYQFDLEGSVTLHGTLLDPYLRGIHDANGNLVPGTTSDDGGVNINSRVIITPTEGGVHYVAAGSRHEEGPLAKGTYKLSVTNIPSEDDEHWDWNPGWAPSFRASGYAFSLAENADGSTDAVALGSVSATDPQGQTVTYGIVDGNDAGLFSINATTGALTYVGAGEDFETTASHELTVRASDGSLHADTFVTVRVTNVEEAPSFGAGSYAFDLAENVDGSRAPVALGSVVAAAESGNAVRYGIVGGNDAGLFAIDATTGALTYTGSGEDHEAAASHVLTVEASDGSLRATVEVTVAVTDTAEAPGFDHVFGYGFSLAESADGSVNPVALGSVSATDPDGDRLRYSIVEGNASGLFAMDAATGALSYTGAGGALDVGTSHRLTVRASDGSLHADAAVHVVVDDWTETEDIAAGTATAATVAVGGSARGSIGPPTDQGGEATYDRDWFRMELEAGKTYKIAAEGRVDGKGTIRQASVKALHDAEGDRVPHYVTGYDYTYFAPSESGTYYVAVGSSEFWPGEHERWDPQNNGGSYTVTVNEYTTSKKAVGLSELTSYLTDGWWDYWSTKTGYPRHTPHDTSESNQIAVDLTRLTERSRELARWALEAWEAVADIEFVESTSGGSPIVFTDDQPGGFGTKYEVGVPSGMLSSSEFDLVRGAYDTNEAHAFYFYLHEIGHALGLGHLGPYPREVGEWPWFERQAIFADDSWQMSVMSYFSQAANYLTDASWARPATPMMADIMAISDLYGAPGSASATAGDTIWGKGSNLGGHLGHLSALLASGAQGGYLPVAATIYDRDGIDTLDLSASVKDNRIDLRDGRFSDVNGLVGNLGIARGTVIENLVSGSGSDDVTGNDADNRIDGGMGDDTLRGGKGDDTLRGGGGNDTLDGGEGDDTLDGGEGDDILRGGEDDDTLDGRKDDDVLDGGGGRDLLRIGRGDDTATGGIDADTFDFIGRDIGRNTVTDFEPGTDTLRLDNALWADTLSATQVIERFASLVNGNVVFDFGDGNTITLRGVATTAGLADDLEMLTTTAPGTPIFDALRYAFDLAENADGSATPVALGSVSATDPNDDTVTYTDLQGEQNGIERAQALAPAPAFRSHVKDNTGFMLHVS